MPPKDHYPVHIVQEYKTLSLIDKFIISSILKSSINRLIIIDGQIRLLFKTNPGFNIDYRGYRYLMRKAIKVCKILIKHEDIGRKIYPEFYASEYFTNLYDNIEIQKSIKSLRVSISNEALKSYYDLLKEKITINGTKSNKAR